MTYYITVFQEYINRNYIYQIGCIIKIEDYYRVKKNKSFWSYNTVFQDCLFYTNVRFKNLQVQSSYFNNYELVDDISCREVNFITKLYQPLASNKVFKFFYALRFGVLTTTYIRAGSTRMFNDYLRRYAESDCDAYDNIYIIWNNDQSPQEMGVMANRQKWKKNVYFMPTVQNSLDFKYIIPPWASEKVFFSMDDDFDISCQTLKNGFHQWQNSSFGQIGPLTAFYGRSFVFDAQTQSFTYIDQVKLNKKWNYYHFGLTGIAFISRHFLQLYYADINQLREMRKHVVEKFNCEDILLNFIVSYLYPEVSPKYVDLPFKSLGITGVSATKTHKEYRAQCISKFSDIIGYNPLRYVQAHPNHTLMERKTDIQQGCMINLKQEHYEKTFISSRSYYLYIKRITGVDNDFTRDENMRLLEAKQDIVAFMEKRKQQVGKKSSSKKNIKANKDKNQGVVGKERKMLGDDEMMMHFGQEEQMQKFADKFSGHQTSKTQTPKIQEFKPIQTLVDQKSKDVISIDEVKKQSSIVENTENKEAIGFGAFTIEQNSFIKIDEFVFYLSIVAIVVATVIAIKKLVVGNVRTYQSVSIPNETLVQ